MMARDGVRVRMQSSFAQTPRSIIFDSITSHLFSERDFQRLLTLTQLAAQDVLYAAEPVDVLPHYSEEMWEIMTSDWGEKCGSELPLPTEEEMNVMGWFWRLGVILCLDRGTARIISQRVRDRCIPWLNAQGGKSNAFECYGLKVGNGYQREQEGLEFLARQATHFTEEGQRLILLALVTTELWEEIKDRP